MKIDRMPFYNRDRLDFARCHHVVPFSVLPPLRDQTQNQWEKFYTALQRCL